MTKYIIFTMIGLVFVLGGLYLLSNKKTKPITQINNTLDEKTLPTPVIKKFRYVSIGDSLTIGQGVRENDRYPNLLIKQLQESGIEIELIANPAVSGYTVQNAIDYELPVIISERPNFVTVAIGANDNFRRLDKEIYRQRLTELLDGILVYLPNKKNLVLLTIYDYSRSPQAKSINSTKENEDQYSKSIQEYNDVIKQEADKRGLKVADVFPISQQIGNDPTMFVGDGLHPSAKQYQLWVKEIYPVVYDLLKSK
ncbi:MAG TPA: SGNH/GDSL hydrolase family protein [Candidatus Nitrosocosmicus sp.]|nr:SGNH/GDSL hydrolase family protein [Candidatus Nitrosocosmicus sp.]